MGCDQNLVVSAEDIGLGGRIRIAERDGRIDDALGALAGIL
jgi:hypothetical protein